MWAQPPRLCGRAQLATYDNAGNRLTKTNYQDSSVEQYAYDPLYQLTQVTRNGSVAESYSYDKVGNRLSSATVATYSYNSSNQLTSSSDGLSYTYDNNGNTTAKTDASGTTQYSWDYENRLTSVNPAGGGTVTFKYDPFGRRIQKSGPSGTTNYVYDGANVAAEVDNTGAAIAHYAQDLGIDEALAMQRSGTLSFYSADGLGSITSLTTGTGALADTFRYDTFGDLASSTGAIVNPYRYTAREYDTDSGLYYYRARYYDPNIGRFLSEDPIGFIAGIDFYDYAANSPISWSDPLGLQGALGNNPFPQMAGNALGVFNDSLGLAKKTACNPDCDGSLQDYGIKSLAALVNQMTANVNVYDGRKSTYPYGKQTVSQFLAQGTAGAVAFTDVELTFLGDYFWNPTSIDSMSQQRALILLHESVHEFGHRSDSDFGKIDGSRKLSERIAEKCFPVLKALRKLSSLTN